MNFEIKEKLGISVMIVDANDATISFDDMASELENLGNEIGVAIKAQKEEIFNAMHRI